MKNADDHTDQSTEGQASEISEANQTNHSDENEPEIRIKPITPRSKPRGVLAE